ncbi:flagellar basal body-associated FliL family protein [Paracoccus sp. 1_MG-2023]|uniref:flagellar basal body-associated FliL family protein n=1 Tax=unclassified Paracoccus (in: a-proteobacteria) TaxID=2688777 RepID=UPI001C09285A|nr:MULTISPECIES: flagellar basal body-associated FliL family protein [unclassified Paracoccus (in: a-proteobacteria)]MBU2956821.1 flagellar basal body-associated FliL family protein [Paracoccus sp. C2R09]MDO6670206.1 flagellar basal body-associated FliL family protein [Paracoccus sp. 1_MG-2023]
MTTALAAPAEQAPKSKKGMLIPAAAALVLAGAGFASTFLGVWSPGQLLAGDKTATEASAHAGVEFVDIPMIETIIPGGGGRSLVLSATVETDAAHHADVEHLMPRLSDAFTTFLSGVDAQAYDKRGVLEIIRTELLSRSRMVLGQDAIKDLLITEFRFK